MNVIDDSGEHANELLEAHAHVWNHMFGFIKSMSLKCAVELAIPDIIQNHGKPMTVTELLVAALPTLNPTKACNIYRLMRILVHSGFFAQKKLSNDAQEDGYVLTSASRLLLNDNPLSVTPLLKAMLDPVLTKPWDFLGIWFQNNDYTPFDIAHGKTFWEYASHDPKLGNSFNEAMASDARLVSSVLIDKCKGSFEGLNSLVDVGGGTGTLGKAIADAFPNLECTVFDLPHVVADQQDSGNLKYVGGDMFEDVPVADAVLLKWILHDWNDDECLKILKRCKEAITNQDNFTSITNQDRQVMIKKKVIIIDMVLMEDNGVNDEIRKSIETQLLFDMLMMTLLTGRERQEEEWSKLLSAAGFNDYKITPILGLRSLIEVYP
ncbi:8-hydroxyquercetin 8-O-methyltransferase [Hibiscus syriacus]|uniref:8-hydroxyquercetin 8-O-methyltransferase n=1 Tax=Hibiscus syriacus TaxID=106335 RepID=A0A6A2X6V2_HIBSY|nr:8-hydroxyquercetin 8-O-methyltransferase [Hibiscus syriacus]